jgi:hypothetical protein
MQATIASNKHQTGENKMATIQDVAAQFDRLCPSQVDATISGNGQQEAGHIGHNNDGVFSIGWFCSGGNVGESLCEIPADAIDTLHDRLAAMEDGSLDNGGIEKIVREVGGKW